MSDKNFKVKNGLTIEGTVNTTITADNSGGILVNGLPNTGPQGIQGLPGTNGSNGATGANGLPGATGGPGTYSTSQPSGGVNGDVWYVYS